MKVTIERVSNGFIITTPANIMRVEKTLTDAMNQLLIIFKGLSPYFSGNSFGQVVIYTNKEDIPENQTL